MVPDIDPWTTPVVGTIGLLLQAVATAAKTRQEVLTRLVDLEKTFSNINSFAGTFPKDQEVREVSVHLVVAIFQAVEQAIGFFAKSAGRKAATAVLTGGDYQKDLLNSFDEVQKQSDYLIQKAQNSHFATTRAAILEVLYNQAQAAQKSADAKNEIKDLLEGYARENERDRKDREELRQLVAIQQKQNQELLAILNHSQTIPRPVSPLPVTLALPPPARSWEVTLLCLIDGMVYYERDEFIGEMQYVLTEIVRLVGDPTVQANVKLLITSPWRTDMAQQFFQEDREILHMEGMPSVELTPSASRVIYRHISHTESGQSSRDNSPSRGDEQQ
ncbi:hypothetical protein FJTKL_09690 [Diaporthe vaccinii]|uniref:Fungal N-terminal domain-containing protein n=1 Tax=Diaporthe vaccinii TaxID=105482 RepID=A0ABR4EMR8_9PEZI